MDNISMVKSKKRHDSIANALELFLSCTNPPISRFIFWNASVCVSWCNLHWNLLVKWPQVPKYYLHAYQWRLSLPTDTCMLHQAWMIYPPPSVEILNLLVVGVILIQYTMVSMYVILASLSCMGSNMAISHVKLILYFNWEKDHLRLLSNTP